ncbi:F0F1 ATP synthase subunit B family protein [Methylovirgula sp. 4M-Z18]|uniref:F0F1 ATP synthase subunit B family protein n=1 Tax=Methylovirgula sp. 4M-Z18 TaxID=2293567 RepID=UPI000E2F27D7|nr:F0F1 ATP synthase subunit B' [Methylovirgula sp. 4M-Z18]RFB78874.1 F0F1 ATP synthase subunit B' [Methylovirgula sp. 4M-Z18]
MATKILLAQADTPAPTQAATEAPGHVTADADFPPFDTTQWSHQIIWLIIVFGILYWLMSKIALPRVGGILADRKARISKDIDDAVQMDAQAKAAGEAYDKALAVAKGNAQALAQDTHAKLADETNAKRHELEDDLNGKLAAAEAQIAATKANAMSHVGEIAHDAAAAIVQHLTGKPVDQSQIAQAVAAAHG